MLTDKVCINLSVALIITDEGEKWRVFKKLLN